MSLCFLALRAFKHTMLQSKFRDAKIKKTHQGSPRFHTSVFSLEVFSHVFYKHYFFFRRIACKNSEFISTAFFSDCK